MTRRIVVAASLIAVVTSCSLDMETAYLDVTDAMRAQELSVILEERPFPEEPVGGRIPDNFPFPMPEGGTLWESVREDYGSVKLFSVSAEYPLDQLDAILGQIEAFFAEYEDTEQTDLTAVRSWITILGGVRIDLTSTSDALRLVVAHGVWAPPTVTYD